MSNEVTNADLYQALGGIRESIGGLKASVDLTLKGLENHSERIGALEKSAAAQKGAVKVWGMVATAAATIVGATVPVVVKLFRH